MNKKEIGRLFEKEAFKILSNKFNDVIWLSDKNIKSTFDFQFTRHDGTIGYIDAKHCSFGNKPSIKKKQESADFIIFKNKNNEIKIIPHDKFHTEAIVEKDREYLEFVNFEPNGRVRKIVKIGSSFDIRLSPIDMEDLELAVGDYVDLRDIIKLVRIKNE